jgi:predicted nucleic acid-binding protein
MVVIADTSPLNYLVLIEQPEVLPRLYGEVVVPQAVLEELLHPDTPLPVAQWIASAPSWLIIERNIPPVSGLSGDLDLGERQALELAEANQPDVLLLIDEDKGRREAERRKIRTTGTLGILDAAAAIGLLDLATVLARLETTSFFVSQELLHRLLDRDAVRRKARGQS